MGPETGVFPILSSNHCAHLAPCIAVNLWWFHPLSFSFWLIFHLSLPDPLFFLEPWSPLDQPYWGTVFSNHQLRTDFFLTSGKWISKGLPKGRMRPPVLEWRFLYLDHRILGILVHSHFLWESERHTRSWAPPVQTGSVLHPPDPSPTDRHISAAPGKPTQEIYPDLPLGIYSLYFKWKIPRKRHIYRGRNESNPRSCVISLYGQSRCVSHCISIREN